MTQNCENCERQAKRTPPDKLLPINIVTKRLGLSGKTIWRLIQTGDIVAINCSAGGILPRYKIAESEVARFIKERQTYTEGE
jgi:hypothetical protein